MRTLDEMRHVEPGEWNGWKLKGSCKALYYEKYEGSDPLYEVRLDEIRTPQAAYQWILHLHLKPWAGDDCIRGLIQAFKDILGGPYEELTTEEIDKRIRLWCSPEWWQWLTTKQQYLDDCQGALDVIGYLAFQETNHPTEFTYMPEAWFPMEEGV